MDKGRTLLSQEVSRRSCWWILLLLEEESDKPLRTKLSARNLRHIRRKMKFLKKRPAVRGPQMRIPRRDLGSARETRPS
ncbi:hypothetical protein AAFF_G00065350 [Aldrovandia affinis]|uniref:Uncharacterized protein n=1 Tax=Aldrovandia affinis TaxID=143900 RepID=A0AAD7WYJ9_9TELE|nr:hypothetical protein AAFF_G00065350 [Aldrovandia affinis]